MQFNNTMNACGMFHYFDSILEGCLYFS